jgi:hypothetical protein
MDVPRMRIARSLGVDPERLLVWPTIVPATFGCWGRGPWAVAVQGLTWAEYGRMTDAARRCGAVLCHPDG